MTRWLCEAHQLWTTRDCPKCDDEMIADLERTYPAPVTATCNKCGRDIRVGETAWASDWTVLEPEGPRHETRFTCDTCEEES